MGIINWSGLSPIFIVLLMFMLLLWVLGAYSIIKRLNSRSALISTGASVALFYSLLTALIPIEWIRPEGITKIEVAMFFICFWLINPIVCIIGAFHLLGQCRAGDKTIQLDKGRRDFLKGASRASLYSVALFNFVLFSRPLIVPEDRLQVIDYQIGLNTDRPINIAFISDLHAGFFLSRRLLEDILFHAESRRPDLFLIGGDIVDHSSADIKGIEWFLRALTRLCPVISVLGNHDIVSGGNAVQRLLQGIGIRVLRDESSQINDSLTIFGLRDEMQEEISDVFIRSTDKGGIRLLLTHNPKATYKLSANAMSSIDLILAGHTHGGQIRLPGVGALVNPGGMEFRPGMVRLKPTIPPIIVTRGIGYTGIPLRLNSDPEMVFVRIVNQGSGGMA